MTFYRVLYDYMCFVDGVIYGWNTYGKCDFIVWWCVWIGYVFLNMRFCLYFFWPLQKLFQILGNYKKAKKIVWKNCICILDLHSGNALLSICIIYLLWMVFWSEYGWSDIGISVCVVIVFFLHFDFVFVFIETNFQL